MATFSPTVLCNCVYCPAMCEVYTETFSNVQKGQLVRQGIEISRQATGLEGYFIVYPFRHPRSASWRICSAGSDDAWRLLIYPAYFAPQPAEKGIVSHATRANASRPFGWSIHAGLSINYSVSSFQEPEGQST
jgi:hypothetical protein